jgi:transposase InsO family protein
MPEHRLRSDDEFQRIEVITGVARRRRWTPEQTLKMVEASFRSGETACVSVIASLALARIGEWIEDYNQFHLHSALRMRSPHGWVSA